MNKKTLWLFFSVFFIFSIVLLSQKISINQHKNYAFTVDYNSILNIHKLGGLPSSDISDTFEKLKEHKIKTVTLSNNNLFSLKDRGLLDFNTGSDLFGRTNNPKFQNEFVYIHVYNNDKEITDIIKERFSSFKLDVVKDHNITYLGINLNYNKLMYLSLPFLDSDVDFLVKNGFNVVFKVDNKFDDSYKTFITSLNGYIKSYPKTNFSIEFTESGYLTFGYDKEISLNELPDVPYLYKEFFSNDEKQKGFSKIAANKDFIRYHFINSNIYTGSAKELDVLIDRILLAITERNIPVVGFQLPNTIDNTSTYDIFNEFLEMIDKSNNALADLGYLSNDEAFSTFTTPIPASITHILQVFTYFGAVTFIFICVREFIALKPIFYFYSLLLTAIVFITGDISISALLLKVIALAFVICIPFFAYFVLLKHLNESKPSTLVSTLKCYVLVNIFVVSLASVIPTLHFNELYFKYILKFDGITLATTIPIFLVLLLTLISKTTFNMKTIMDILKKPVYIYQIILFAIIGLALMFYVSRTGNSGSLLPFEAEFRQLMTDLFGVRPRTKEFLIAQPILMVAIYYFHKFKYTKFLLPVAVLGQISIVNTFCHLHTPVLINLIRSSLGVFLGLLIGLAIILVLNIIFKQIKKHKSK